MSVDKLIDEMRLSDFDCEILPDGSRKYSHKYFLVGAIIKDGFKGDTLEEVKAAIRRAIENARTESNHESK